MSAPSNQQPAPGAVFLSYASQDVEAAARICDSLRAAGIEVWFDKNELGGGDAWDRKIRQQIKECALFVPVISVTTQARGEGYFRLEWKLAVDRSHLMAPDQPFLLPVVIDNTPDAAARVADEFRAVQWTRLTPASSNGHADDPTAAFCARVKALLSRSARGLEHPPLPQQGVPVEIARPQGAATPRRVWWAAVGAAALVVVGVGAWQIRFTGDAPPAAAPASPSAAAIAKVHTIVAKDADASRNDWLLAESIGAEAVRQNPADGRAWAAYAEANVGLWLFYVDRARDVLADALKHAQKAVSLAPDAAEATVVLAAAYAQRRETRGEAEQALRALVAQRPTDGRVLRLLAATLRQKAAEANDDTSDPPDGTNEIISLYDRASREPAHTALALREKAAFLIGLGRLKEAEPVLERSAALRPGPATTALKVTTLLRLGRLDDACAELERMPGSYLLREDMVDLASRAWLWKREPERCLRVLNGWSEDFLGGRPKGLLIGQANALLKKHEAARLAWQAALGKVEQQIAETAGTTHTRPYLFFRAQLLAHLRDQARSEEAFHAVEQIGYPSTTRRAELLVVMGRPAEAVQSLWEVRARFRGGRVNMSSVSLGRAELRHDPIWDPIRADPRFQEVIALWERRIVRGDGTAEGLRR